MRWIAVLGAVALLVAGAGQPAHADRALPSSEIRPARAGELGHQRVEVSSGDRVVDVGATHRAEFTSEVTLPRRSAGKRPLVVFLHGAHGSCYRGGEADYGWPCPRGYRPTPSYQGYRYLADRLATQGFASVSISADGVNGQQDDFADGGTTARALLTDTHLRAIATAARGSESAYPRSVAGQIDLSRVLLVGHSRGASAMAVLALQNRYTTAPYRVRGVMSLAGVLQVKLAVPGLPFVAVLPQCDGDVFMLEGQNYVEAGSRLPGDSALRSAVWIPGANHNYLNTQWTPGLAKAPAVNDAAVYNTWAGPCRKGKRLGSGQERRAARSYVAAMARLTLYGDRNMTQFLDGSPVRPGDVGEVATRTTATAGQLLERQWRGAVARQGLKAATVKALSSAGDFGWNDTQTPHWLPALKFPTISTGQRALMVAWKRPGTALHRLAGARDITGAREIRARIAVDTNTWRAGAVSLAVRDAAGVTARVRVRRDQLTQIGANLPGHLWAQSVGVSTRDLRRAAPRLDLRRIRWVGLSPRAGSGRVWILDMWSVPRSITTTDLSSRPAAVKAEGFTTWSDGRYRVRLVIRALAPASHATTVRYKISGYDVDGIRASGAVTLGEGQKVVRTTVKVRGKRDDRLIVATYPDRWGINQQDYVWLFTRRS